jgi:hypothetical protein
MSSSPPEKNECAHWVPQKVLPPMRTAHSSQTDL